MKEFHFLHIAWPWIISFSLLCSVLGYAEIHFRLPGVPSYLFMKEPEIIFDLPYRGLFQQDIPLFLFIKDAHLFPIELLEVHFTIVLTRCSASFQMHHKLGEKMGERFASRVFTLPSNYFPEPGNYHVVAELHYQINGKYRKCQQDNYRTIPHPPFEIYIAEDPFPTLSAWYWGDFHVHSNYTADQLEFGAPISETVTAAKSLGLSFIGITDHAYDLDDGGDNSLSNDSSLKKWMQYQEEINNLQQTQSGFCIIAGEEVSVGNRLGQNVHCLVLGNQQFYPGYGDSGERLFQNRPTLPLPTLLKNLPEETIAAAAHPLIIPPYSQRLILNRGHWTPEDLISPRMDFWQILNGNPGKRFRQGFDLWKNTIARGRQVGLLAGNDAHGNFNCYRQIIIPFFKIIRHNDHILGKMRTGLLINAPLTSENILKALKQKRVIISTGPFAAIQACVEARTFLIGDTLSRGLPLRLHIQAKSIKDFGHLEKIYLYFADFNRKEEKQIAIPVECSSYELETDRPITPDSPGYLRLEVYTRKNDREYFAFTNPIWIS